MSRIRKMVDRLFEATQPGPEDPKFNVVRVMSHGVGEWAVHQPYGARYLNAQGEWDRPMFCKHFTSPEAAKTFAEQMLAQHGGTYPVAESQASAPGLISVTVHLEDGSSYETDINAQVSDEEIRQYFVGQRLQFGDTPQNPKDDLKKVTGVEIHRPEGRGASGHRHVDPRGKHAGYQTPYDEKL